MDENHIFWTIWLAEKKSHRDVTVLTKCDLFDGQNYGLSFLATPSVPAHRWSIGVANNFGPDFEAKMGPEFSNEFWRHHK